MLQFIVINQFYLNDNGMLVCKNPSGRHYQRAHFKQGELDGVSCVYSIAITFNILNVLNAEDTNSRLGTDKITQQPQPLSQRAQSK